MSNPEVIKPKIESIFVYLPKIVVFMLALSNLLYIRSHLHSGLQLTSQKYALDWFWISEIPSRMPVAEIIRALLIEFALFFTLLTLTLIIKRRSTDSKSNV